MDWDDLAECLVDQLGAGVVFRDSVVREGYASDETRDRHCLPDLVVKPGTVEAVSRILAFCHQRNLPVTPRGGGSGVSGGALAVQGGVVLCLERLNHIGTPDKRNMTIEVETGAITADVQDLLLGQGYCLPPDPGSRTWCQIGGNLAHTAAGPKSVKYGAFKDYVLNLQVVLPSGEIIWTGANVRKFATGYNLTALMLGSEGTLGVITRVVFRVIAAPEAEILLRLAFPRLEQACELICRVFETGLVPSEVEFMEADAIAAAQRACQGGAPPGTAAMVWVGFDGPVEEALMDDAGRLSALAEELGASEVLFAGETQHKQALWSYRHQVGPAVIEQTPFRDVDVSFPRGALLQVVTGVKEIGKRRGFRTVIFGHAGDGNLHVNVCRDNLDDDAWQGEVKAGIAEIYQLAVELGGTLSGEHGIGCTLVEHMQAAFGPTYVALLKGIKQVFDPKGILNPGKILL